MNNLKMIMNEPGCCFTARIPSQVNLSLKTWFIACSPEININKSDDHHYEWENAVAFDFCCKRAAFTMRSEPCKTITNQYVTRDRCAVNPGHWLRSREQGCTLILTHLCHLTLPRLVMDGEMQFLIRTVKQWLPNRFKLARPLLFQRGINGRDPRETLRCSVGHQSL